MMFGLKRVKARLSKKSRQKNFDPERAVREKTDVVFRKVANNEASRQEVEWLENIYRATFIKKYFFNSKPRKWPSRHALIALVCIILGGLLLMLRVGDIPVIGFWATNTVSIQARCKALQISLADLERPNIINFDELLITDQLEMRNLSTIAVSNAPISIYDSSANLNLKLRADTLFLDAIECGMESVLNIKPFQEMIHLTTNSHHIKVSASFNNGQFLQPVQQHIHSLNNSDVPIFARFESLNPGNAETTIKFRQNGPVNILKGRKINALAFSDNYVYGADILKHISTIQSGTLTLNDVDRSIDLHKQDRFILEDLKGWIIDFGIANGAIDLFFKGTARDIKAGPEGAEKDLSPSLLEYLFNNQPLALFWGAVVFLWGLLNGIISHIKIS